MKEIAHWEVSLVIFKEEDRIFYKVTRRMALFSVAETKIFTSKEDALKQFQEWLNI